MNYVHHSSCGNVCEPSDLVQGCAELRESGGFATTFYILERSGKKAVDYGS